MCRHTSLSVRSLKYRHCPYDILVYHRPRGSLLGALNEFFLSCTTGWDSSGYQSRSGRSVSGSRQFIVCTVPDQHYALFRFDHVPHVMIGQSISLVLAVQCQGYVYFIVCMVSDL